MYHQKLRNIYTVFDTMLRTMPRDRKYSFDEEYRLSLETGYPISDLPLKRNLHLLLTEQSFSKEQILRIAEIGCRGWTENPPTTSYENQGLRLQRPYNGGMEEIQIWFMSEKQTVGTSLIHPKYGKVKMHSQKPLTRGELVKMLQQPTGRGTGLRLHTENKRRRDNARRR